MARPRKFVDAEVRERFAQVFSIRGYHGTSIDDLIAASGLSRSSLYSSFGDKKNIYRQLVELDAKRGIEELEAVIVKASDSIEGSVTFFEQTVTEIWKARPVTRLWVSSLFEAGDETKEARAIAQRTCARFIAVWRKALQEGQKSGSIPEELAPQAFAESLMNSWLGLHLLGRTSSRIESLRNVVGVIFGG